MVAKHGTKINPGLCWACVGLRVLVFQFAIETQREQDRSGSRLHAHRAQIYIIMSRHAIVAVIIALSLAGSAFSQHAALHNESCSHEEGTCRPSQHITTGLPSLLFDSDQALLGHIEKDFHSAAMQPASFPSFLPSDGLGYGGTVIDLPQPVLKREGETVSTAPLSRASATAGNMDALGLF